jgi:hypothetical protein
MAQSVGSVRRSRPDRPPRGSWFSPRSALAAASSGPKRRLSNVHNGLVKVVLCGPTATGGVARTLAPEGKLTVSALSRYGFFDDFRRLSRAGPSGTVRQCARCCAR